MELDPSSSTAASQGTSRMGFPEILVRRETLDEQRVKGAQFLPAMGQKHDKDGSFVLTAMDENDLEICWMCREKFNESNPKLRRVLVQIRDARVQIHAGCENRRVFSVQAFLRATNEVRVKEGMRNVIQGSNRIAKAALEGARRIIGP